VKHQAAIPYDDSLFAVAERLADRLRVLLVRKGARPTVLEAREFAPQDASGLAQWLDLKLCRDLRVILPATSVIVRSTNLPAASPSQMLTALALQAESYFLGSVPQHRLGLAVLNEGSAVERRGLIIAWPTSQPAPETPQRLDPITSYLPEPAAMAPLASGDLPAISADRRSGSIAIALRSADGVVLRSTREDGLGDAWAEGLRRAIAETALNAGVEPSKIAALVASTESSADITSDRVLVLDADLRGLLGGRIQVDVGAESLDQTWWRNWAVLLGAAIVACGPFAPLCALRRHEKGSEPTRMARLIERYSEPSRAMRVLAAAFVITAVAPIAFAWLRAQVYQWKMPSTLGEFQTQQRDVEQRIAHYEVLARKGLPATKLLGDLGVATPDGIELESIQLSLTQGVSVRGTAKTQAGKSPDEIVYQMAQQMDASGVFQKTSWNWSTPDGRSVFKFSLNADIARPTRMPEYPEARDYSIKTLAQRKYPDPDAAKPSSDKHDDKHDETQPGHSDAVTSAGDAGKAKPPTPGAASNPVVAQASGRTQTAVGAPGNTAAATTEPTHTDPAHTDGAASGNGPAVPDRGIGRRTTTDPNGTPKPPVSGGAGTGAGGGPGSVAKANLVVPDTFTDDQLKAMPKAELRDKLKVFADARRREDLDAETKQRINIDFNRILEALKALNGS
jgi:hypothetical protein